MIELKQNKIWSDSLSTTLGLAKPWDELEKPLQKFICFGEGGDGGGAGGGGGDDSDDDDAETDVEFGEPTADMTTSEAVSSTSAADAVGGLAGIGDPGPTPTNPKVLTAVEKRNIPRNRQQEILAKFEKDARAFKGPPEVQPMEIMGYRPGKPFSFSEFITDVIEFVAPPIGYGIRGLSTVFSNEAKAIGLNTQSPLSEIASVLGTIGATELAQGFEGKAQDVDTAISDTISGVTSNPSASSSSFGEPDGSGGSTGLASVVQQNPLEVRPQDEVQSSASGTSRITRRPFNFTPGRIFAQTGGGIQDLINKEPTLLDVVNKGMAMPEETIPAQRPQQFISGQQQPGGLRSTNYYTNAMQPASFYAQPQQVRNYGSIY